MRRFVQLVGGLALPVVDVVDGELDCEGLSNWTRPSGRPNAPRSWILGAVLKLVWMPVVVSDGVHSVRALEGPAGRERMRRHTYHAATHAVRLARKG